MRKEYLVPQVKIATFDVDSCLLVGSPTPDSDISVKSDEETITVSKGEQQGGSPDVDYAKKHNSWSVWDD